MIKCDENAMKVPKAIKGKVPLEYSEVMGSPAKTQTKGKVSWLKK